VATNRFNRLILQPGGWTNQSAEALTFTNSLFRRDLPWTTNYYGYILFDDGDPNSAAPDYLTWVLSIDDANDTNRNGIPDFSDDPQTGPPSRQPQLMLGSSLTNLVLTLSGDAGRLYDIQQTFSVVGMDSALPITNWQTLFTITLTNNSQAILIPKPASATGFWRVQAH